MKADIDICFFAMVFTAKITMRADCHGTLHYWTVWIITFCNQSSFLLAKCHATPLACCIGFRVKGVRAYHFLFFRPCSRMTLGAQAFLIFLIYNVFISIMIHYDIKLYLIILILRLNFIIMIWKILIIIKKQSFIQIIMIFIIIT